MFQFNELKIPGCYEIITKKLLDQRGHFTKTFHSEFFNNEGLEFEIQEQYYSYSKQNVFRGMHFQLPPKDHGKLVYCALGEVEDYLLDIRKGSPYYGYIQRINLSAEKSNMVYMPPGIAHGFYVPHNEALMVYNVSSVYDPTYDSGILWCSLDIKLMENPIISERDTSFSKFSEFETPFIFKL